jgi:hypothetical protein
LIIDQRMNYLLDKAEDALAGDTDVLRQLGRGVPELVKEIRTLQERSRAVEELVRDAAESGDDVQAYKVLDALRGPSEPPTAEQVRLWKVYYDNEYNERVGAHVPVDRFMEKKNLCLRCNWCAYLAGGWVHVEWHENQPHWLAEEMLRERKEKLGE